MTGMCLISAQIIDPFRKLHLFRKWDNGIDIHRGDKTLYTTQYQKAFLKYVVNEYSAKQWKMSIIKPKNISDSHHFPSAKASGFGQSSFDPYNLSRNNEEYLRPRSMAEKTPRRSDHAACWLTATRLYWNSPPEAPKNWEQVSSNPNKYHSDCMEISDKLWLPDVTHWWRQQEETHSKYTNLYNVPCNVISIIPHDVQVEASFSLGQHIIGWRQSKITSKTV